MRWFARLMLATVIGGLSVLSSASHVSAAQARRSMTLTRLYAGSDGQARAADMPVPLRPSALRAGLDESEPVKVSSAQFVRWPRGYVWEWHTATTRQYVITVSGRGEVEVAGGQKIRLTPGRIVLADDVTGKGHITRVIGSEDLILLLVPVATQ